MEEKFTNNIIMEVEIDGVARIVGDSITIKNITRSKQQDLNRILMKGGKVPTDEEYALAEAKCQQIYNELMEV